MEEGFVRYVGHATKDKKLNSYKLEVYLVDTLPGVDGDINERVTESTESTDANDNISKVETDKGLTITAIWKRGGSSNRMTAPDIKTGETIEVFRYAGSDVYYWDDTLVEPDLRGKESALYLWGNTNEKGVINSRENSYYLLIDGNGKKVVLHTPNNDGEPVAIDLVIDTAKGTLKVSDSKNKTGLLLDFKNSKAKVYAKDIDIIAKDKMNIEANDLSIKTNKFKIKTKTFTLDTTTLKFTSKKSTIDSSLLDLKGSILNIDAFVKFNKRMITSNNLTIIPAPGPLPHTHIIL